MANTLSDFFPKLLAQGLLALRQQAIMPRLVNRAYEAEAGQKGSSIDVPVPSAITVASVTPGATPPANTDITTSKVTINLDKWKEARFYLSDKDKLEAASGFMPVQASEAIKALANQIDGDIMDLYKDVYGYAGVAGTTPFGTDLQEFTDARTVLNKQLAALDPRYVVLNPDAEGKAIMLRAFQDASFRGDAAGIIEGQIGRKLGANWWMDQNVKKHTAGTGSGYLVNDATPPVAGEKTVTTDTGSGTVLAGDIITFASVTGTYVVVSSVGGGTVTSITFEPGLEQNLADNAAITLKATHVVNLAFHRDAFAFATRPLAEADGEQLGKYLSAVDPVSGLTLRLEVSREYKQTTYSFDVLYGVKTVRAAFAARIAG
jgi:hypothetical protein